MSDAPSVGVLVSPKREWYMNLEDTELQEEQEDKSCVVSLIWDSPIVLKFTDTKSRIETASKTLA